ncbi:enoyl-CoA hydratase/isomerase family protein [Yinghuangia aomiensis]
MPREAAGPEFLTALDLRYGTPRTVVGWPEVAVGILPGASTTARLPGLLGRAKTLELLLTARDFDADEARALGWLQAIVEPSELAGRVRAVARRIAAMPPAAVAAVKHVVDVAASDPEAALLEESRAVDALMAAGSQIAPMTAFLIAGARLARPRRIRRGSRRLSTRYSRAAADQPSDGQQAATDCRVTAADGLMGASHPLPCRGAVMLRPAPKRFWTTPTGGASSSSTGPPPSA